MKQAVSLETFIKIKKLLGKALLSRDIDVNASVHFTIKCGNWNWRDKLWLRALREGNKQKCQTGEMHDGVPVSHEERDQVLGSCY